MRSEWQLPGRGFHVRLPRAPGRHLDALIAPHAPQAFGLPAALASGSEYQVHLDACAVATTLWYRERLLSVADIAALTRLVSSCTATT